MNIDFSKITPQVKRWLNLVLVILLIYGAFLFLAPQIYRFNPQYLVETSILKKKTFSVPVQEIISPKYKIKAYLYEEHSNPIVSVAWIFKNSGVAYEPSQKIGLGKILSDILLKGAGRYNNKTFNEILEQKAIHLNFDNGKDTFYGSLKFIKKDMKQAVEMANLALFKPILDNKYLQRSKSDLISLYLHQQEKPDSSLQMEAAKQLFGNHPYSRHTYGNPQTAKNITAFDLRNYMRQHFSKNNLMTGISGDVTAEEAGNLLDQLFKGMPNKSQVKEIAESQVEFSAEDFNIQRPLPQVVGYFYAKGISEQDKDFYPLKLALEIFSGGGLTSRIQKSAREEKGLTYGVYGQIVNYDKADMIIGRFSSTPQKITQLQEIIKSEWQKMGEYGVTEDELNQVKNYLTASEPLRYADIDNLSATLVYMQNKNLGLDFLQKRNDYIENVTLEDINRVVKQYFTAENLRFMTIGNIKKEE